MATHYHKFRKGRITCTSHSRLPPFVRTLASHFEQSSLEDLLKHTPRLEALHLIHLIKGDDPKLAWLCMVSSCGSSMTTLPTSVLASETFQFASLLFVLRVVYRRDRLCDLWDLNSPSGQSEKSKDKRLRKMEWWSTWCEEENRLEAGLDHQLDQKDIDRGLLAVREQPKNLGLIFGCVVSTSARSFSTDIGSEFE